MSARPVSKRRARGLLVLLTLLVGCSRTPQASTGDLSQAPVSAPNEPAVEVPVASEPTAIPDGPQPLVVATLMGETGVMKRLDGPALAGALGEVDRLNADGGILGRTIEVKRFDTNSRLSTAEREMERLINDPPDLILVTCDVDFAQPILDLAAAAGIVTISPCADDAGFLTGAFGPRNFTLGAPEETRGELGAEIALERFGSTAVVLRDVTSPEALAFCDGFERAFRQLGGTIVYRDEFQYDTPEPVQDRLAERDPRSAVIVVCSHVPGGQDAAPSLITMVRTIGLDAPILSGSTVDELTWFRSVPLLGDLVFISWSSAHGNDPDDRVNEVIEWATAVYDRVGDPLSAVRVGGTTILGAEAIDAWARAADAVRSVEPGPLAAALGSFSNEPFSTGEVSFAAGARMDIGRVYRIIGVSDGELSVIGLRETDG